MEAMKKCTSLLVIATLILTLSPMVVSQNGCSNGILWATSNAQSITSPNYPSNYSSYTDCQWSITTDTNLVIELKVLDFSLEGTSPSCANDFVTIYDGPSTASPTIQKLCDQVSSLSLISIGPSMTIVFHSDELVNMTGFKLEYTSQPKSALCNFTIWNNGTFDYVTSPGYPNRYTSDLDCSWIITANSPGEVVVLNLVDFNLESSTTCSSDYLIIYDGNSTSSPIIEKLCGRVPSTQRASSGMYMTVEFHSDEGDNYSGFKFYSTVEANSVRCGNGTLLATESLNYLVSPNYPGNYTSNTNCQWTITAASPSDVVVLRVLSFQLENSAYCQFDYVTVYDGYIASSSVLNKTCGQLSSQPFISTGPVLIVYFHSDELTNLAGYMFEYTSQTKSELCSNFTYWQSDSNQFITSPGYPYSYTSGLDCSWRLTADSPSKVVMLRLISFLLTGYQSACASDYVYIYDGYNTSSPRIQTLCGRISENTQYESTGRYMFLVFHSNEGYNNGGFGLSYTFPSKRAPCSDVTLSAGLFTEYLSSPNYPDQYPSNMDCKWYIKTYSDSSVVKLTASDYNFDGSLPLCAGAYVKIYDGPSTDSTLLKLVCGYYTSWTIKSTGSDMTVVFHSDTGSSVYNRFRFTYSYEDTYQPSNDDTVDTDDSDYSSPSAGSVTGIVFGCIIFTSFSTTLGVFYRRRTVLRMRATTRSTVVTQNVSSQNNTRTDNNVFVVAVINNTTNVTSDQPTEIQSSDIRPELPNNPQNPQSPYDPPRYSTLMNSDMNDSSLNYAPRNPGYSGNGAPPPYDEMPGGAQGSGGGAHFNQGFDANMDPSHSYKYPDPSAPIRDSLYNK